jgi:hypothetical protein
MVTLDYQWIIVQNKINPAYILLVWRGKNWKINPAYVLLANLNHHHHSLWETILYEDPSISIFDVSVGSKKVSTQLIVIIESGDLLIRMFDNEWSLHLCLKNLTCFGILTFSTPVYSSAHGPIFIVQVSGRPVPLKSLEQLQLFNCFRLCCIFLKRSWTVIWPSVWNM